jgi:DnaJ-class molecular chaperone
MRDLYSVLQVAPNASDAEIKSAFRNLAKTCHPDVRPGDREAGHAFQEAKRAYQLLSNSETRKAYDAFLANQRAAERARRRRAATTMSATFLLTAAAICLVAIWLQQGGFPIGRLIGGAIQRAGAHEMARTLAQAAEGTESKAASAAARLPADQTEAVGSTPARP